MTKGTRAPIAGGLHIAGVSCVLCAVFCFLFLAGCFSLDSFLFEPTKLTGGYLHPADMDTAWHVRFIIPDSLIEPVTLVSQGNKIYGFFVHSDGVHPVQNPVTVLYSHGNYGNINRYWGRVELLWEMGYKVFIYEYEGYGMAEGTPSGAACYADAETALSYCQRRPDVDTSRLVDYGWSLGSFMTCHLAADIRHPSAVILEAPVASTTSLTSEGTVLNVPGSFVVNADFDNEKRIANIDAPLLMIHGRDDSTSTFERNALVLYNEADPTSTEAVWLDHAGHENIPEAMGTAYGDTITSFISRVVP